jgi:hypothetical protein
LQDFNSEPESVVRHVHHLSGRVEPPLEVDVGLRVGNDLAGYPGSLLSSHPEDLDLIWLAVGRDWKVKCWGGWLQTSWSGIF